MKSKFKKMAAIASGLACSSMALLAQTTPAADLADAAETQLGTIIPAMTGVFVAGIAVTIGFVVYRKVRKGINGA